MKDKVMGYIFCSKTKLIDPNDARGEFGIGGQDDNGSTPRFASRSTKGGSPSSLAEKSALILNKGLLSCADAIFKRLEGVLCSINAVKESFAPKMSSSSRNTEILNLMQRLQDRTNFLERQGGATAHTKIVALQNKLNAYEDRMLEAD